MVLTAMGRLRLSFPAMAVTSNVPPKKGKRQGDSAARGGHGQSQSDESGDGGRRVHRRCAARHVYGQGTRHVEMPRRLCRAVITSIRLLRDRSACEKAFATDDESKDGGARDSRPSSFFNTVQSETLAREPWSPETRRLDPTSSTRTCVQTSSGSRLCWRYCDVLRHRQAAPTEIQPPLKNTSDGREYKSPGWVLGERSGNLACRK